MIKAEKNWVNFFSKFSQNNGPFIHVLTKNHPDLTGSQFKVCSFLRAGYNTQGISELMDLSVRSVESHRFRLRQKFSLSSSENLVTHLMNYS
jgi:DNA-binding NarL/FixJ family response regulator